MSWVPSAASPASSRWKSAPSATTSFSSQRRKTPGRRMKSSSPGRLRMGMGSRVISVRPPFGSGGLWVGNAVGARETGQRFREVLFQAAHRALDALATAVGGEAQALADLATRLALDQHRDEQLRGLANHGLQPRAPPRDVLVEREPGGEAERRAALALPPTLERGSVEAAHVERIAVGVVVAVVVAPRLGLGPHALLAVHHVALGAAHQRGR